MPVGFNSPARNLFLLGSSGAQVATNFFKSIDQSSSTDGTFVPSEIKFNYLDQKYILSGSASDSNSKYVGWIEKRDYDSTTDPENPTSTSEWDVRIQATQSSANTLLLAMELDSNNNLVVAGRTSSIPWVAKYSNAGVLDWQSTSNTGDLSYTGITSDSNGNYYACGSTDGGTPATLEAVAFVEKFDSNGNPGWGKQAFMLGRDVVLEKISANSRGEVVAVGFLEDDSAEKGYIVKIDTNTGEVLWDRTLERNISGYGGSSNDDIAAAEVRCTACYIDSKDQIYVVGTITGNSPVDNGTGEFLIKYSPEGNIIWQKENETIHYTALDGAPNVVPFDVKSDGETEQTVVLSVEDQGSFALNDSDIFITKYSKNGDLVFRRKISKGIDNLGAASLDADPSFYYILFRDQKFDVLAGEPDRYTFGKVSTSGNGLGAFQYDDLGPTATDIDYTVISNAENKIGRLSDGSVRNDTSDLVTYPFTANKLVFDDLATHVSNKRRQMDSADSFEYGGSPAIRINEFDQELNLLGNVYSGSGDWLDQSGKGRDTSASPGEPFYGSGGARFDGIDNYLEIANSTDFQFGTGDWTIEFWWKGFPSGSFTAVITTLISSNEAGTWRIGTRYNSTNRIYFARGTGSDFTDRQIDVNVNDNRWHHIAFVRSNGVIIPFVDGVDRTSDLVNGNLLDSNSMTTSNPVKIGYNQRDNAYIEGSVSQLRVVKGIAVYTSNFTPPTEALTAIPGTSLLTCQGLSITDASSSNHTITDPNAGSSAMVQSDLPIGRPTYNAAGYWDFDGFSEYLDASPPILKNYAGGTIEAWFKTGDSTTNGSTIYSEHTSGITGAGWAHLRIRGGKLRYTINPASGLTVKIQCAKFVDDNNWHHVVFTGSGSGSNGYKFYIDGMRYNESIIGDDNGYKWFNNNPATNEYSIGKTGQSTDGNNYFMGSLGDVRIYSRALTQAQAHQNYNATKSKYINEAPSTAPRITDKSIVIDSLRLYYDFGNRATYDTAQNLIPNSEDFTKWNQAVHFWENNYAIAPDGTKTAALLKESIPSQQQLSYHNIGLGGTSLVVGETYTFSVYAKANTRDTFEMHMYGDSSASFNLTTGSSTSTSSMTDVGDGWWLCKWVREKTNTAGFDYVYLGFSGSTYAGAGVDESIFIWHPQFERDVTRGRYIKTSGISITAPTTVKNLSSSSSGVGASLYTGTINGGATFNSDGYFEFDGTDDYIQSSSLVAPSEADFSVIMWYKITSTSGRGGLMERAADAPFTGWFLGHSGTTRWAAQVRDADNDEVDFEFTFPTVDQWTCDAFTWNTSTQSLAPYRNGAAAAGTATQSGNAVGSLDGNTRYPMAIGARLNDSGAQYKPMECGEVQIYIKALTAAEVLQNFNATRSKYGV
ncbi:virion structural protein [Synechococcus phage ACG-2014h]|uniref:Structural protein n=1 Tax=Synechococcus phage ACG-2014h TaxID=1340810 RepID=V5USF6_9CAUD|nr:virion structural protein [Synechococcus phage ACG-2014h]AHB80593.1 structural protein [Synechococcus phage ACG-2014h]